ncbi:rod shape-determining protein MreD [Calidifontibacillus erzurumensis]|uniref:Rod shape-determining protein MreD n=1 Tax=Calidifontibacillus erzurumensis TaxID=2741433 RepID=A0A8J8GGZ9_9BACI|nr:rod shape-determining protein MreD [Calidifontibacillus erzurumensis]NSL51616.1 rod shape-determining protein MreD [Calidifontibacillus erzurumensis]
MKRFLLACIIFLGFLLESIFVEFLPSERFGIDRIFVPHFMIVLIMLISFFYNRNKAIIYALFFGLLFDIIYTNIIGVYLFTFPLIVYLISLFMKVLHTNLLVVFFVVLFGIVLLEMSVFGILYLVNVAHMDWQRFVLDRLYPTLVLNGFFLILVYYPMKKFLLKKLISKETDKLA